MNRLTIYVSLFFLSSCIYPYYTQKRLVNDKSVKGQLNKEDIRISSFHYSAALRRGTSRIISDTLSLDVQIDSMLVAVLKDYDFPIEGLVNDPVLATLIDPDLRWKRKKMTKFLKRQGFSGNVMVPIICYSSSKAPERSGGGGIGPIYETGNDRYHIVRDVYIALYQEEKLRFLQRAIRFDEKIVPAGTPITHEFPQAVLDTLMHMALEPLLKQMDKEQ